MAEPVGEDAWLSLVDEASRSAGYLEQRVEVVELYKSAVGAEPYSLRLWHAYCEWVWSLYTDCQSSDAGWPQEELLVGQELFSLDIALEIWQQGALATQYRLNDSHVLWNRWISIELEELEKKVEPQTIERVQGLFMERLQVPHAKWEETSQMFSTFITKYDESAWEATMVTITQLAKTAKELYSQREVHELNLQRAINSGDKETQETTILDYLAWEGIQCGKKNGRPALIFALYERALLLLSTNAGLWQEYISALTSHASRLDINGPNQNSGVEDVATEPDILSVLQRATRHCPWSGALWSRYILQAEVESYPFSVVEEIKHAATGSGQLDRDGMSDVLAVYTAWCGFLRRRAVSEDASDEEIDLADVGLPSALESFQEWGERLYGKKIYKGDPSFRIEQCLIRYLAQKGSINEARSQWQRLVKSHGDSYEFWQRYYTWEMSVDHVDPYRTLATAALRQAVTRRGLDWPEKIMEIYLQHCEIYAEPHTLVAAIDLIYKISRGVAKRRHLEAMEAAVAYTTQQDQQMGSVVNEPSIENLPLGHSKRKRDSVSEADGTASKKLRSDQYAGHLSQHLQRDRENTSVLVSNLPPDVTQTRIRQYFKEYGHINNLAVKVESDGNSSTALIEFRSTEDVKSAIIKDGKYFGDKQIHVEAGTGLTLYVTNYPPAADEAYVRELFSECGEIFSIRWPSLKYNTHRRFCYVSFRSTGAAAAATQLDGKLLEGRYKLEAKYSDPGKKKSREGAGAEGRELHVANIDRTATEDDLCEIFSKYGKIENVRILRNLAGKSKGGGFVVFEKKEDATEAITLDKTKFKSQVLTVELSTHANYKPIAITLGTKTSSASPAPDDDGDSRMSSSLAPSSNHPKHPGPSRDEISKRTITILNIPDTINDARIRGLVEPYGAIIKLTLRPDHQGAIIEFAEVASAGKAALGLENYEIAAGRRLRTGDLKDLFQEKGEFRTDRIQTGAGAKKATSMMRTGFIQPAAPVRRPGRRGGLGTKRGLGYTAVAVSKKVAVAAEQVNGNGSAAPTNEDGSENEKSHVKSNADFKAMLLEGK